MALNETQLNPSKFQEFAERMNPICESSRDRAAESDGLRRVRPAFARRPFGETGNRQIKGDGMSG